MRTRILLLSLLLLALPALPAVAGPPADSDLEGIKPAVLFPGARFDPSIPTQKEWVGLEHGGRPLRHAELIGYLERLAELSPRAQIREYSTTHEGRKMVYLAISEPETISRLDAVRTAHVALTDPRGRAAADDAALIEKSKAVAWMAYGIHGDELSQRRRGRGGGLLARRRRGRPCEKASRELVISSTRARTPTAASASSRRPASFAHAAPNPDHGRPLAYHRLALGPRQPLPVRSQPRLVQHGAPGEPAFDA